MGISLKQIPMSPCCLGPWSLSFPRMACTIVSSILQSIPEPLTKNNLDLFKVEKVWFLVHALKGYKLLSASIIDLTWPHSRCKKATIIINNDYNKQK